ncbi:hypothetical protein BB558_006179 [Smittium angustum]|uniref:GB1/RHD3-type G domain-containing protein n=1 Tax=Smittium angustum TaxID=133377 RepID=A0A2U1IYF8_SMIAN|nr:hypothetical protein BB558_006179 [Smittium angustum]
MYDKDDLDVAVVPQLEKKQNQQNSNDSDEQDPNIDALLKANRDIKPSINQISQSNVNNLPASGHRSGRDMLQLVDENQEFSEKMSDYMRDRWQLENKGFDFDVVAVFGSQSTGKSTLLNSLFKTNFEEMKQGKRQQTTRGIWCDRAEGMDVLVLDVEGTDGRERGEDQDFERKSALFSLAIAEVVIVNMWEHMVGLYNGANMGLLKTVFEVNLQLFDHVSPSSLESLGATVTKDLERIWSELSKPGELADEELSDHFDIRFSSLPHKLLQPEKFESSVQKLWHDFGSPETKNYVFKKQYKRNVPADGFPRYLEAVWEKIVTNRDLDLPTQQELLAQYRCDEISAVTLVPFRETVNKIRRSIEGGKVVDGLGVEISKACNFAMEQFDVQASRYHNVVYLKKRQQLLTTVYGELQTLYIGQIKNAIAISISEFEERSQKQLEDREDEVNIQSTRPLSSQIASSTTSPLSFSYIIKIQRKRALEYLESVADSVKLEGTDWEYSEELRNLEQKLNSVTGKLRGLELEKILIRTCSRAGSELSGIVSEFLSDAPKDMWENILLSYVEQARITETDLETLIEEMGSYGLQNKTNEGESYNGEDIQNLELEYVKMRARQLLFENMIKILKDEVSDQMLVLKLRNKFEEKFRYDSSGVPRVWSASDDIDGSFASSKSEALKLLPLYSKIDMSGIIKNSILKSTLGSSGYFYPVNGPVAIGTLNLKKFNYASNTDLLNSYKQREVSKRAAREIDVLFLDAKRSVVSQRSQIPPWMFILMALLGWNEAMTVLFNPVYLVLLIFIGTAVFFIHSLGLWSPVMRVFRSASVNATQTLHNLAIQAANITQTTSNTENIELSELKRSNTGSSGKKRDSKYLKAEPVSNADASDEYSEASISNVSIEESANRSTTDFESVKGNLLPKQPSFKKNPNLALPAGGGGTTTGGNESDVDSGF